MPKSWSFRASMATRTQKLYGDAAGSLDLPAEAGSHISSGCRRPLCSCGFRLQAEDPAGASVHERQEAEPAAATTFITLIPIVDALLGCLTAAPVLIDTSSAVRSTVVTTRGGLGSALAVRSHRRFRWRSGIAIGRCRDGQRSSHGRRGRDWRIAGREKRSGRKSGDTHERDDHEPCAGGLGRSYGIVCFLTKSALARSSLARDETAAGRAVPAELCGGTWHIRNPPLGADLGLSGRDARMAPSEGGAWRKKRADCGDRRREWHRGPLRPIVPGDV